jgi:DnaK suppressor protein
VTDPATDPLAGEQAAALAQIEALTREFGQMVAASKESNADDEHDPEGATIAFERQQVVALLDQARVRLAEVEAALARREAGRYGVCDSCAGAIGAGRLAARPAARTCIHCAR